MAELVARRQGGRPGGVRRAGAAHLRRHLHPGLPADRRRGGRRRRGAGVLPAGLPGPEALPGRRPVHHLALPDHRPTAPSTHLGRRGPPPPRRARRRRRRSTTSGPTANPEASLDSAALRDRLQVALRRLPPRLRAVVVLRDIYDLPHEAIAAELGISESAAKVRLHRARRKLREDLSVPAPIGRRPTGRQAAERRRRSARAV